MSIFKRGDKYWIDFRYNGSRFRKPSPENTSAGAKMYESVLRQKIARGEPIRVANDEVPLFSDFASRWMETYVSTNNKPSEILNKQSLLRAHLLPFFGRIKLDKIKTVDIERYKSEKLQSGQSPKSVNNHLIALSKCLNVAKDWDIIITGPKIRLLKTPPQSFDFLDEQECQLLIDNCSGMVRDMVIVALKTGLRLGELLALRWEDIDFSNQIITVQRSVTRGIIGSPKSNKIRHIPFFDEINFILSNIANRDGFVFGEGGIPLKPITCLRWLNKSCKQAGIKTVGWHDLRHTFASHLAQRGISILIIKELLGHSDVKTTMRYAHLSGCATKEAVGSLNRFGHNTDTVIKISTQMVEKRASL